VPALPAFLGTPAHPLDPYQLRSKKKKEELKEKKIPKFCFLACARIAYIPSTLPMT
jgi:hypothetical protein